MAYSAEALLRGDDFYMNYGHPFDHYALNPYFGWYPQWPSADWSANTPWYTRYDTFPYVTGHNAGYPDYRQVRQFPTGPERPGQRPPYLHLVDLATMFPNDIFRHGPENQRRVALTFDDGPDDVWTPQIQEILDRYNVKATFFCVGMMVRRFPRVVRSLVEQGHVVGNHTWDHPHLPRLQPSQVRDEVRRTQDEIIRAAGVRTRLFRPPYGQLDVDVVHEVIGMDYKIILWNVDSLCWAGLDGPQIATNVLMHMQPGAIVLMHSAGGVSRAPTVQALPYIIDITLAAGYTFTTIPQLLNISPYEGRDGDMLPDD
jgi:peptidoglycan/xylan/chitin deacetylase (PgdA/CDA1 family)